MYIKTNNIPRGILCGYDLTIAEREEFDYIREENPDEWASYRFFRYKGIVYDTCEFMRIPDHAAGVNQLGDFSRWDGYQSDSFFSGIVIRYVDDYERVIVGGYFS